MAEGTFPSTSTGLTDAELRATAVPVSGTVALGAGAASIGTLGANSGVDIGDVTINNASLAVTGTFWQATQPVSGTFWQATQPVSAAALPLPSGASTEAKQPALGAAGTASTDVITVQGIASMTALKVDGSAVTQPVSGTFWQATQPVSGTVAVTSTPLTDLAAAIKNEDSGSGNLDLGFPSMAVQKATPANTAGTDGDYEFLQMSVGRLWTSAVIDSALPTGANVIGSIANTAFTANAGTNLNTSALALESGGNLAAINTSTSGMSAKLPATLGQKAMAASMSVALASDQSTLAVSLASVPSHAVTNAGTFAVQDSQWRAEDDAASSGHAGVPILGVRNDSAVAKTSTDSDYGHLAIDSAGRIGIADLGGSIAVTGTFWQATQPVSGTVALGAGAASIGTLGANSGVDIGDVTINNAAGASAVNIQDGGNSLTVDSTQLPAALGQTTMAASMAVTIASNQTVIPISDNSGSLTVDAPVGTPAFVRLSDGASAITTLPVSLASVPSHAVTNAGTFAVQDSEKIADNAGFTDGTTKVMPIGYIYDEVAGTALTENDIAAARVDSKRAQIGVIEDGTTRGRWATVSASNALKVDGSAVTQPVSGTFWQATQPVSGTVSITANSAVNVAQMNGVATTMGAGNSDTGVQRITVATDDINLAAINTSTSGMSAKLPATLGQKTMANSMAVVLASDQTSIPVTAGVGTSTTGTLTSAANGTALACEGAAGVTVEVTNTFSATYKIEASYDNGTTYFTVPSWMWGYVEVAGVAATLRAFAGTASSLTTTMALYIDTEAYTHVRVVTTAYTSGTLSYRLTPLPYSRTLLQGTDAVSINGTSIATGNGVVSSGVQRVSLASDSTGQVTLAAGANAIGTLGANSGVDIGDVDVTSVIPGTGATNLGKAIDSAVGATDTGVAALVVRDDVLAAITPVDGDYTTLRVDNFGKVHVAFPKAATSTDVSLASAATSAQLLAANTARTGLMITNTDANAVYLYYGTTATSTKFTVKIGSGGYWEMPQPIWTGRIDVIWAADGAGSLIGSELAN